MIEMKDEMERLLSGKMSAGKTRRLRAPKKAPVYKEHKVIEIPAKPDERFLKNPDAKMSRAAAYCRVSTDQEEQLQSYKSQIAYYTKVISESSNEQFIGIYSDEGITGTNMDHREGFKKMIQDCIDEKVDIIWVKSMSRFGRNVADVLNTVQLLKSLKHPVKIYFETEGIDSFDDDAEMAIIMHAMIAQGESRAKSCNVTWGTRRRFQAGYPRCPTFALLGYTTDENGEMAIVPDEEPLVKAIYQMYLNGYSSGYIADTLTRMGIPTPLGGDIWPASTVLSILHNEKYCGDVLMQKTFTVDYKSHKTRKNEGQVAQYYMTDHHPAIISHADWKRVQVMIADRRHYDGMKKCRHGIKPIRKGILRGFVPIDLFGSLMPEDYLALTNSINNNKKKEENNNAGEF